MCAGAYTAKQIVRMEFAVARALNFRFRSATAWDFCAHYWRLLGAEPASGRFRHIGAGTAEERRSQVMADREARGLSGWIETARELSEVSLSSQADIAMVMSDLSVRLRNFFVHVRMQYLVDLSQTEYAFLQYRPSEIAISVSSRAQRGHFISARISFVSSCSCFSNEGVHLLHLW